MVIHSDEVEPRIIEGTQLRGTRWRLGAAAGSDRAGLSRYRIAADERAMPVHVHADEEELFYVLDGEGLSWLPRARAWWNGPHWLPPRRAQPVRSRGGGRPARRARARGGATADDRR